MPVGHIIFDKYEFDHWNPSRYTAWDTFVKQGEDVNVETYRNTSDQDMLKFTMNHPDFFDGEHRHYLTWGLARDHDHVNYRNVITGLHTLNERGVVDGQRTYTYT